MPNPPAAATPPAKIKPDFATRLSVLTRKKKDAERERDELLRQNRDFQDRILALTEQIGLLANPSSRDRDDIPAATLKDLGLEPTARAPKKSDPDILGQVERLLEAKLKPVTDFIAGTQQANARLPVLQASFRRAVEDYPELGDPKTDAHKAFNEFWDARQDEFSALDDGPELAAGIIRGLILSQKATDRAVEERKVAASPAPTKPSAPAARLFELPSEDSKLKELKDKLVDEGSTSRQLSNIELADLINIKVDEAAKSLQEPTQ